MLEELVTGVHQLQNGNEFVENLLSMKSSNLPDVCRKNIVPLLLKCKLAIAVGVFQEYSKEELLDSCMKLKECLILMEEVSSDLLEHLCYGKSTVQAYACRCKYDSSCVCWLCYPSNRVV